jgi:predicted AlkP superfamily pyrophosphatase or phosphodiesterase
MVAFLLSGCSDTPDPPRLIVSVVVDQLRADMLDQFDEAFTHGLRRLRDEGFRFTDGVQDHAFTETAAGHATIGTGVVPARHGIIANQWLNELEGGGFAPMYSVADSTVRILGEPNAPGRSPRNLERDGLADWVQDAHPDAVVLSVSRKDRSAIGLAARASGHVYWLSGSEMRFVTSDNYRSEYPEWVDDFNDNTLPELINNGIWSGEASRAYAALSRPDTTEGENPALGGTAFPHNAGEDADPQRLLGWFQVTPYADVAVARLVERGIVELEMGLDDVPDYLGVGFSATDGVGHAWGPLSREQLDNLLALDRTLGELMDLLDNRVGEGRWVLSLSADHGVLTLPEHLRAQGEDAGRLATSELRAALGTVREIMNGEGTPEEDRSRVDAVFAELEPVADVYWHSDYEQPADSFAAFYANSYYPGRWRNTMSSLGFEYRLQPNYLAQRIGTSHGTPHYYDRHVPIVFVGQGVTPGVSNERARTVDIAPTLAYLARIPAPTDLDGRVVF